jgi:AraC family transcriptional regulator, regulatory protein of adaptative response / methylated-DNA-[protein]-cysteine methyltransferase
MVPFANGTGDANAAIRPNPLIQSSIGTCRLGSLLVAMSDRASILLDDDPAVLRRDLKDRFPEAARGRWLDGQGHCLVAFQQRVWHALPEVPAGSAASAHPTERGEC